MKKNSKNQKTLFIPLLIVVMVLIFSLLFYNMFISDEVNGITDDRIQQLMDSNVEVFQLRFESSIDLLESTASLLPVWDYLRYIDYESGEYNYILNAFDYVMVINPNGYGVGSDGNVGDAYTEEYFQEALEGKTSISELVDTNYKGIKTIVISTPMIANDEIRGVLVGLIYVETLNAMFENPFEGICANLLIDSSGNIISNGVENTKFETNSNAFDSITNNNLKNPDELELLKNDIANNISGDRIIDFNYTKNRVIYTPIGIEGWSIMSIIPESAIQSTTNSILTATYAVTILAISASIIFVFIINSAQRKHVKYIEEIAYISPLTKINTLVKFKLDSKDFISKHSGKDLTLIKFDIDNFRLVNESLGKAEGDRILRSMANVTDLQYADNSLYAHLHNDEFLALISYSDFSIEQWHKNFVEKLNEVLGEDFKYNLKIVTGYYHICDCDRPDIQACLEKVNIAHHNAKEDKSLLSGYSDEYLAHAIKVKEIENSMESALQNGEFKMVLQPELGVNEGKMIAAEALVRWFSPTGMMTPNTFIPIFEQNGFILKLDTYIFEQACAYLKSWIDEGREPFIISVNFSRKHLYTVGFASNLESICKKHGVIPQYLGVEVTETSMLSNEDELISLIHELQGKGFKVLMDDFGTGYSSLGLLKNTPVDVLKLDRSFFTDIQSRERSAAVVNSVIRLSKDLKIKTVAEGIETLEDVKMLKQMGCDIIQGYYYAKPMPLDEFKKFYDSKNCSLVIS